jgi:uncharacterized protein (TIGR02246 family)
MNRRYFLGGVCLIPFVGESKGENAMTLSSGADVTSALTVAIKAYESAWNAGDLDAMAALYTPDVHWVNVRAMHWRGFAEVDRAHRVFFDLMFKGVRNDLLDIESITPVTHDVAVAVILWQFGAFTTPNGHNLPAGRTRMTLVYKRAEPVWKIAHGHNQDVDEGAQQFDPIRGAMGKR